MPFYWHNILVCLEYIFFIRSDNILGCHMVMLQHAPQMLKCTPPRGHVVTFHFQFWRVNKEKRIQCNYETKQHLDNCKTTMDNTSQKVLLCAPLSRFSRAEFLHKFHDFDSQAFNLIWLSWIYIRYHSCQIFSRKNKSLKGALCNI